MLAVDSSRGDARGRARGVRRGAARRSAVVGGDAERLPLATGSVQLVLANLVLPWCRPQKLFAEAARVLEAGGLLLFATLGPDSLQEVRRAWAEVDDRLHVHAAFDMHDLGDLALAAGLAEPVLDVDRLELTYEQPGRARPRPAGLGRGQRRGGPAPRAHGAAGAGGRSSSACRAARRGGRFAVTVELVLGQAWGGGQRRAPRRGPPRRRSRSSESDADGVGVAPDESENRRSLGAERASARIRAARAGRVFRQLQTLQDA